MNRLTTGLAALLVGFCILVAGAPAAEAAEATASAPATTTGTAPADGTNIIW